MRVLLISTYDLGRQPTGLASPAAWLRQEGIEVECADLSRTPLSDAAVASAGLIAFHLPMHTATRLAGPVLARVRQVNPRARIAAYGLYAPLNADWLRDQGVTDVLGSDAEADLVALAGARRSVPARVGDAGPHEPRQMSPTRALSVVPDRSTLPPLSRYAALQMPDGTRRVAGTTDATRGCKHLCRHCPIVPVYQGTFRAVPLDTVMEDVRRQVSAGAQHISFGDPDFLNGPTHARRLVERVASECPGLTYDVTIKVEHLLRHADLLPLLRRTGCVFVTSAVESVDDGVLARLGKGHTRADFVSAVEICRAAGVVLSPTFVPFTPWTTLDGYGDLLDQIEALDLAPQVAPIQLAIRLLVTSRSKLLELDDLRTALEPFDPQSLTYPWKNRDPRVDDLQQDVMRLVSQHARAPRADAFARIAARARGGGDGPATAGADGRRSVDLTPPYLTESWYCCAEPGPEQVDLM